jgi:hypothetical protein
MNGAGRRMNITHGRLNIIVPSHVLQRKGVCLLTGFCEKRVAHPA